MSNTPTIPPALFTGNYWKVNKKGLHTNVQMCPAGKHLVCVKIDEKPNENVTKKLPHNQPLHT